MKSRKTTVIVLILLAVLITFLPIFLLPGAEFEGSDEQGTEMVYEVTGYQYEAWFDPVLETLIDGEIPAEIEALLFSIQTGIGVGVLAYCFGYLVARKKYGDEKEGKKQASKTAAQGS